MTPRQWTRVQEVFAEAARTERSGRDAYLARTCRNEDIRREVKSLLAQHDKAENLLGVYSSVGGKILSHYEIHERIGEGGMALIYRARDTRLQRWVVLKVLQPWAMGQSGFHQRLIKEARCASALNHANIVTVHEVAEENGVCFIVMEYLTGKTLDKVIPPEGFPVQTARDYAIQIADALSAAEAAGILHGDLKPLNIMVTDSGQVKLLDFGLAKSLSASLCESEETPLWARFGTKAYMAPERLRDLGCDTDPRSEVFSFGLILHQLLSGKHAFSTVAPDAVPNAIRSQEPGVLPAKVPVSLAKIVRRCLEKSPERRFQSMHDLVAALRKSDGPNRTSNALAVARLSESRVISDAHSQRVAAVRGKSAVIHEVRAALRQIGYQNLARSRKALDELEHLMAGGPSAMTREAVTAALRDLILNLDNWDGRIVPSAVREVRKRALEVIKVSTLGDLGWCFKDRDLEHLDLYGMNFKGQQLSGLSFRSSFLVEASFEACNLSGVFFAGACVRNVSFANADLSGADFTDADWFNALALTESQLQSGRQETLMDCPASIEMMYRYLATRYALPFELWSREVQDQLKATWNEYLRPEGLRDAVAQWRSKSS